MSIHTLEQVTSEDGDWTVILVDGREYYSGHSVPDSVWLTLLEEWTLLDVSSREITAQQMQEGDY